VVGGYVWGVKMGTGLDCYKFGRKNNWRRQVWNEAVNRLKSMGKLISDCKCLYLPGSENLDGEVAVQKGFKPWNLYAVEINSERAAYLRSKKLNVICADFNDVINSCNNSLKFDFIFADFCGGITLHVRKLMFSLIFANSLQHHGVVCVNMLRGRDSEVRNKYRDCLFDLPIHRGMQFYRIFIVTLQQINVWAHRDNGIIVSDADKKNSCKQWNKYTEAITKPKVFSYKSVLPKATLIMDSIIFNWGTAINLSPVDDDKVWGCNNKVCESSRGDEDVKYDISFKSDVMRKVSAAKAIHTMRFGN
jgi:L-rhamnose mutarotase